MSRKLKFTGSSRYIPYKALDVGDRLVSIDPRIEIEEIGTLGLPCYAYKYLPLAKIRREYDSGDRGVNRPVTMVAGTIVSLLTDQTVVLDSTEAEEVLGVAVPSGEAELPVYEHAVTGAVIRQSIDESPYGYDDSVVSLVVPANGGQESVIDYTDLDDEYGAWTGSGDGALTLAANIPAGIVYNDVFMDIRGSYLNYELDQDAVGVARAGYVTIPFVDIDQVSNFADTRTSGYVAYDGLNNAENRGYKAVYRKYAFLYFDGNAGEGVSGVPVKSDLYGRFIPQDADANFAPTVQTIGKILATDSRFPKELVDEVRHYPQMKTLPGIKNKGIPTDLYMFVKDSLEAATETAADASDIIEAIQSGAFGYVRIHLGA